MNARNEWTQHLDSAASNIQKDRPLSPGEHEALAVLKETCPAESHETLIADLRRRTRRFRRTVLTGAAAALLIGVGLLLSIDFGGPGEPIGGKPVIASLWLSSDANPLTRDSRATPVPTFQTGERVVVSFEVEKAGRAFLAAVDTEGRLFPASAEARDVERGVHAFAIRLARKAEGRQAFILLFTPESRSTADFREAVKRAAESFSNQGLDWGKMISAVVREFENRSRLETRIAPFEQGDSPEE